MGQLTGVPEARKKTDAFLDDVEKKIDGWQKTTNVRSLEEKLGSRDRMSHWRSNLGSDAAGECRIGGKVSIQEVSS